MILTQTNPDWRNQLYHRRVSQTNLIEIGVYPVLFGYRVRAGFVGAYATELDWCAGNCWLRVQSLYAIVLGILSSCEESAAAFEGIPLQSKLKPYFHDLEFVTTLASLVDEPFEPVVLDQKECETIRW